MTQEDDWAEKEARRLYGLFGGTPAEEWRDAMIHALRAAEAKGVPKWKPIETAPKDGTVVDLWVVAEFVRQPGFDRAERIANCRWQPAKGSNSGAWRHPHGYEYESAEGDLPGGAMYATHWMPITSPPRRTRSSAGGVPEARAEAWRENERLQAGGCARDQTTMKYCAEVAILTYRAEKAKAALRGIRKGDGGWSLAQIAVQALDGVDPSGSPEKDRSQ